MIEAFAERAAAYLADGEKRAEVQKYVAIYLAMMRRLRAGDISEDAAFFRLYNVFYKLRFSGGGGRTSAEVYAGYYRLLETHKRGGRRSPRSSACSASLMR